MGKKNQGTKLSKLPDDSDDEIDSKELAVLNSILRTSTDTPEEYKTLKYVLYASGIFLFLSLPAVDRILELAVPMTNSWLILLGLKTIIFFLVFYVVFYINKKSDD